MDAELVETKLTDNSPVWAVTVPAKDSRNNTVTVALHCTSKTAALLLQTRVQDGVVDVEVLP